MAQPNMAQLQNQFNQNQFPLAGSGPVQVSDHSGIIFLGCVFLKVLTLAMSLTFRLALLACLY